MANVKFTPVAGAPKRIVNRFAILLDSSGSMGGLEAQAVAAYNAQVDAVAEVEKNENQVSTITLGVFPFSYTFYKDGLFRHLNEKPGSVAKMARGDYRPHGGTPLFKSMVEMIERLRTLPDADSPEVAYVITAITDGIDEGSTANDLRRCKELMKEVEATGRWTIAFAVPRSRGGYSSVGDYAKALQRDFGIPAGNILEWEVSAGGMDAMSKQAVASVQNFATARGQGMTNSSNYFAPDLSGLTAKKVASKLDDLSDRFKVWKVEKESRIDDFVRSKKMPYVIGGGYYQLMKSERISPKKGILVREKGKKTIYGGPEARKLIGLPDDAKRIKPGNHGNFDVFIQSASENRIVPRGTELAYDTQARQGAIEPTWQAQAVP